MKVQSPLQMNNYELQNAVVQNQGGFAEHDWRKGQLQFDATQNVDKLAVGIDSGQGAEGTKYRYLLDSRPNGVSNEMLAGFSNTTSDIESALANFFPSCAAVRNFVNALVSSALIYKGTVMPESLKKNTITVDADDYRYAGTAASGTYRHRWYNGNVYRYTATSTPAVGERAYSDTTGSYSFTIADVLSKLYADMFIESGVARSTLPTTKGWLYKSSGSGYFGSVAVETGDSFICNGGTAHTAADYDIVQTNIDLLNIPELGVTASEVARLTLSAGGEGSRKSAVIDANSNGLLTISPYTNVEVDGSVLPAEDGDYDLGSTAHKWANLYAESIFEDGTALASKYYLATNPSGFISGITKAMVEAVLTGSISSHSHAYLPLSGGVITGTIQMNGADSVIPLARNFTYQGSEGWARELAAFKVDGNIKFRIAALGQYVVGAENNGIDYAYIGCNTWDGLNLRISPTSLKWGSNDIYHSGNLTPSDYLKKADGGTLNGDLEIAKTSGQADFTLSVGSGQSQKSSTISQAESGVMTISPADDLEVDGNVKPAEDGDYNLGSAIRKWANVYATTIYENGEALSAKYLGISAKAADAVKLDGYGSTAFLRLATGGTLTGPLIIDGSDGGNSLNILNGAYLNIYSDEDSNSALFFLYRDSEAIVKLSVDENGVLTLSGESGTSASFDAPSIKENGEALSAKYAPKATTPKMFRADITGNAQGNQSKFDVTHSLGTQSPIVQIYEETTHEQVLVDVKAANANKVEITFGAAVPAGKVYNVVIMG